MKLTNPVDAPQMLTTLGLTVEPGETVEVTGDDAQSLLAQGWKRSDRPKKRPRRSTADDDAADEPVADEPAPADEPEADPATDEAPASDEGD